jgi:tetratricopeptide (TPR) repeat protein
MAADLLRLCAFLSPDAIPEEILTMGMTLLDSGMTPLANDEVLYAFNEAIVVLRNYSLLRREAGTKILSIHRLVQAVLKDAMDHETHRKWVEQVVMIVSSVFLPVDFTLWSRFERLLPHVRVCAASIAQERLVTSEAGRLLNRAGVYLLERARYSEAESFIHQALAIRQQCQESISHDIANSLSTLANLYRAQGRLMEVEPLLQQILQIDKVSLGAEHLEVATDLCNLVELYRVQGKYEEAESLQVESLNITEKRVGKAHPLTATNLNNLALIYQAQGKNAEAESLFQQVNAIRETQLGLEHPDTALIDLSKEN